MSEIPFLSKDQVLRLIEDLKSRKGRVNELITIVLPRGKSLADLSRLITSEMNESKNIKNKKTRNNILRGLESLYALKNNYANIKFEKGLICYAANEYTDKFGKEGKLTLMFTTDFFLKKALYSCGSSFQVNFLEEFLENSAKIFTLIIDKSERIIRVIENNGIHLLRHLHSMVPGKQRHGGQSAMRFERLRGLALHEFFMEVTDVFRGILEGKEITRIYYAGPGPIKQEFYEKNYLGYPYQEKIKALFDCGYVDLNILKDLILEGKIELNTRFSVTKKLFEKFKKQIQRQSIATFTHLGLLNDPATKIKIKDVLLKENSFFLRLEFTCPTCKTFPEYVYIENVIPVMVCEFCNQKKINTKKEKIKEALLAEKINVHIISEKHEDFSFLAAYGGIFFIL
jgi:peptide chain release factor subunit 1